jgi:ParB family chromosome partitioning protein
MRRNAGPVYDTDPGTLSDTGTLSRPLRERHRMRMRNLRRNFSLASENRKISHTERRQDSCLREPENFPDDFRLESGKLFGYTHLPMAKQALGKGLGALIRGSNSSKDGAAETSGEFKRVREVAIDLVVPSPLQPRTHFGDSPLDDLVESIRQHGVIQPLIVRPVNGKLELIAGERRWRASAKLGLATVPVLEREASDRDVLEMALIENLQREDLNPMEEAMGYVRLAREFAMKQDEIASRVGKSRASVANAMRLLDLHADIQSMVAQGLITVGHAKAVLSLKDHASQLLVTDRIIRQQLTVRAAEKLAQSVLNGETGSPNPRTNTGKGAATADIHIRRVADRLRDHLATHVVIHHASKKGRIEIEYYGNDDLQRLLDLIGLPGAE